MLIHGGNRNRLLENKDRYELKEIRKKRKWKVEQVVYLCLCHREKKEARLKGEKTEDRGRQSYELCIYFIYISSWQLDKPQGVTQTPLCNGVRNSSNRTGMILERKSM